MPTTLFRSVGIESPKLARYRSYALVLGSLGCGFFELSKELDYAPLIAGVLMAGIGVVWSMSLWRPFSCWVHVSAVGLCALMVGVTFPTTANHGYLILWMSAVGTWACLAAPSGAKADIALLARWLAVSVLLGSGLQKIAHGAYDHGEYFAYHIVKGSPRFVWFWELVLGGIEKLTLNVGVIRGTGLYRLQSSLGIALSAAVPVAEVVLSLLLLSRYRAAAAVAAMAFILLIQVVAGEFSFAIVMLVLMSAFLGPRTQLTVARAASLSFFLLVVATLTGLVSLRDFN